MQLRFSLSLSSFFPTKHVATYPFSKVRLCEKRNQLLRGRFIMRIMHLSYLKSEYAAPCLRAYFHSSLSFLFFIPREDAEESEEILKGQRETSGAFTPLPASGYTCVATGDSPRSSIINVRWVSQVEAPKSIYPTAFCARVKCIVRSAIVCARSRTHTSIKRER